MLTQGPAPDPKCELNSHHSTCARDVMIILLLLQVMGGWEGWGVVHLR